LAFTNIFDESKSIYTGDTSFSFLYLSDNVSFRKPSVENIDCALEKALIQLSNNKTLSLVDKKAKELKKKHPDLFLEWYPRLKDRIIIQKPSTVCDKFYPSIQEMVYSDSSWEAFGKFLIFYNSETQRNEQINKSTLSKFEAKKTSTIGKLTSNAKSTFLALLESNKHKIIPLTHVNKVYRSGQLGEIKYSVWTRSFDLDAFDEVASIALEEQWKTNSLNNGSMPYAYCYGSSNGCGGYYCSKIEVINGGSDLITLVKNTGGKVLRHGYIKNGRSMTFNVPDGSYQVFFYSGTGWDPRKFISNTYCGIIKGGFVSGEESSKDDIIELEGNIMTYRLVMQQNGNFSTKPSSKSEAFN
jgi:hypothetical protein